jgi:hypothetical protein
MVLGIWEGEEGRRGEEIVCWVDRLFAISLLLTPSDSFCPFFSSFSVWISQITYNLFAHPSAPFVPSSLASLNPDRMSLCFEGVEGASAASIISTYILILTNFADGMNE